MRLKPFVKYHGGKFYLCKWISSFFPLHENYLEVFGGGGSVLLNKFKSGPETYNDFDRDIYSVFWAIKNHPKEFKKSLQEIEYCRDNFKKSKGFNSTDLFTNAVWAFVSYRMSRGGQRVSFSWSSRQYRGMPEQLSMWLTTINSIDNYANRLKDVELTNLDFEESIKSAQSDWLIYCDPPYMPSTRTYKKAYTSELSIDDHNRLAKTLNQSSAKSIVSGYRCDEYDTWYSGWRREDKEVFNHSSQKSAKEKKVECLWLNF
jgi:DNA adenine methylase